LNHTKGTLQVSNFNRGKIYKKTPSRLKKKTQSVNQSIVLFNHLCVKLVADQSTLFLGLYLTILKISNSDSSNKNDIIINKI
jgi:hypothetical protein